MDSDTAERRRQERKLRADTARDSVLQIISRCPIHSLVGLDEVGRGPLAGPVTAAAVILDPASPIQGLGDSKQLSASVRETLDPLIRSSALAWGLGWVWPDEIESLNIHYASLLAMRRAFATMLGQEPEKNQPQWISANQRKGPSILPVEYRQQAFTAVADGAHTPDLKGLPWNGRTYSLVKGDALCAAISAASIIAKVTRDAWMSRYAETDSRYGFERHMGYGTPEHKAALRRHGPCPIHRLSWIKD